jgi:hypothetical protein
MDRQAEGRQVRSDPPGSPLLLILKFRMRVQVAANRQELPKRRSIDVLRRIHVSFSRAEVSPVTRQSQRSASHQRTACPGDFRYV